MRLVVLFAATSFAMATGAMAQGPPCGTPPCGPPEEPPGFTTKDITVVGPDMTFMGMSNKAPPNPNAAASQGTRTEHTVDTYTVTGPPGQVNNWDGPGDSCAGCTGTETPTSSETVVTDYPGANK